MSTPDLDHILSASRAEAARRGGSTRIGVEGTEVAMSGMRPGRLALALARVYCVPVLGRFGALVAESLCLPPHLRDRTRAERAAQEPAAELES
jgi:hypothetical protein